MKSLLTLAVLALMMSAPAAADYDPEMRVFAFTCDYEDDCKLHWPAVTLAECLEADKETDENYTVYCMIDAMPQARAPGPDMPVK